MLADDQKIQSRPLIMIVMILTFALAIAASWVFLGEETGLTVLFFLLVIGLISWRFYKGGKK